MALKKGLDTKLWKAGLGTAPVVVGTMVEVRSASASREYGVQVEGVGADGEIGAILYGSERKTMSMEGYANASSNALTDDLGSAVTVAGVAGFVTKLNISDSNEDFSIAKAEGKGYTGIATLSDLTTAG